MVLGLWVRRGGIPVGGWDGEGCISWDADIEMVWMAREQIGFRGLWKISRIDELCSLPLRCDCEFPVLGHGDVNEVQSPRTTSRAHQPGGIFLFLCLSFYYYE